MLANTMVTIVSLSDFPSLRAFFNSEANTERFNGTLKPAYLWNIGAKSGSKYDAASATFPNGLSIAYWIFWEEMTDGAVLIDVFEASSKCTGNIFLELSGMKKKHV